MVPPLWLVVSSICVLLLLLWGWQSGMLNQAGRFLTGLVSPASYQGAYDYQQGAQDGPPSADRQAAEGDLNAPATPDAPTGETPSASDTPPGQPEPGAQDDNELRPPALADEDAVKDVPVETPATEPDEAIAEEPAERTATKKSTRDTVAVADDKAINQELAKHWSLGQLRKFFNLQEQARRLVITVDNLSGEHVPSQMRVTRGMPGLLQVDPDGENFTLSTRNYKRYDAFISFVESLNAKTVARLYARFYPLLQHTYEETGFPDQQFHARVLAAIDDMLAAPNVKGDVALVQPKVLYRFEDPDLEALSPGKKIMIRVGPENAARLKRVLRRLRTAIAARAPQ